MYVALLFALLGGFGLAAYLSLSMAFGVRSVSHIALIMQLHGHLQITGFVGMLLLGVSLYILPRLLGRRLGIESGPGIILGLLTCGIIFFSGALLLPGNVKSSV